jgi:Undecaprenyl-phosphate glucose phosphotransferase
MFTGTPKMSKFSVRQSQSMTGWLVHVLDFSAICFSGWAAYQLRFAAEGEGFVALGTGERLLTLGTALFAAFFFGKVYRLWPGGALASMVGRVTLGWLITWVVLLLVLVLTKTAESFSRIWMVSWLVVGTLALWMGRVVSFFVMAQMRRQGYQHKQVVLFGDSSMLDMVRSRIASATWSGYSIAATFSTEQIAELQQYDSKENPDEIWISLSSKNQAGLTEVLDALRNSVANIRLLPDLVMYRVLNHGMTVTLGMPMVDLSVSPLFGSRQVAKSIFDFAVAAVALVILSPLLICIAIAVKLTSPGPVLFKQRRHGWNNEEIWVYKFRSMKVHQELPDRVTQAVRGDCRLTPIGNFLRKTSFDELPQFINVLQGRMSVVGPRPHALQHNNEYVKLIPKYALRHKVKPGITGWAQVCGHRGETDTLDKMEARIKHDIFYLENWSLWLDLKIIFLTPFATIQNKNVY